MEETPKEKHVCHLYQLLFLSLIWCLASVCICITLEETNRTLLSVPDFLTVAIFDFGRWCVLKLMCQSGICTSPDGHNDNACWLIQLALVSSSVLCDVGGMWCYHISDLLLRSPVRGEYECVLPSIPKLPEQVTQIQSVTASWQGSQKPDTSDVVALTWEDARKHKPVQINIPWVWVFLGPPGYWFTENSQCCIPNFQSAVERKCNINTISPAHSALTRGRGGIPGVVEHPHKLSFFATRMQALFCVCVPSACCGRCLSAVQLLLQIEWE